MASSIARSGSSSLVVAVALALLLLMVVARPGAAQSPSPSAPAPSSSGSCMTEIVSLYPCLGYMSGNASKPSSSCCSALSSVVTSNPRCLCVVLGGGASSLGVTINNTRALELPAACTVKTPPPSQCKSVGVPVPSSPATTPSAPSTTTPQTPSAPSSVPTPAGTAGTGTAKATQTAESSGAGGRASSLLPVAVALLSAAFAALHA